MAREFNVLALIKGEHRYVYVYDDDSRASLIEFFQQQAADPQLSFNWFDAVVMTGKAEEQAATQAAVTAAARGDGDDHDDDAVPRRPAPRF